MAQLRGARGAGWGGPSRRGEHPELSGCRGRVEPNRLGPKPAEARRAAPRRAEPSSPPEASQPSGRFAASSVEGFLARMGLFPSPVSLGS